MMKGRTVSLTECESRSKAIKTLTVPKTRKTNAMARGPATLQFISGRIHLRRNGSRARAILLGMTPFFGFHMPNYTFPGVPDDKLFDHVVEQSKAAEAAGFD